MVGDIILQHRSGWLGYFVSLFTQNHFVHVGIDTGDETIIHVNHTGKHITPAAEWGKTITLRLCTPIEEYQQAALILCCMHEEVKGYSFWGAIKSWFWKNSDDEKLTAAHYHCSGFVSAMYRKALDVDLIDGRSDDTTQPHDFFKSPLLQRVS